MAAPGDTLEQWTFDGGSNPWSAGEQSDLESDTAPESLLLGAGEVSASPLVDLSGVPAAELSFWWSRGSDEDGFCFFFCFDYDPEAGDDLVVEYSADGGSSWQTVATIPGDGAADEKGTVTFAIPQDDLTSQFQLRATNTGTTGGSDLVDHWFIDTVTITEVDPGSVTPVCAADFAVYSGSQLQVASGVEVNGNAVPLGQTGNAIAIDGTRSTQSFDLPALSPANFPPNDTSDDPAPNDNVPEGSYSQIQVGQNDTLTFSDVGGTYHIAQLQVQRGATVELAPGTYFIDQLQTDRQVEFTIVPQGEVDFFIDSQAQFGRQVEINAGGNPNDLTVHLYEDANIDIGRQSNFSGVIYGPDASADVTIRRDTSITGGINVAGQTTLGDGAAITYATSARDSLEELACVSLDHYAIVHSGSMVSCDVEEVVIAAHDGNDNEVDPRNVAIDLATDTGEGTWSRVISGSGSLSDATAGDGTASYTFPGNGETAVTLAFNYTSVAAGSPETVNFDVSSGGAGEAANEDPDLTVSHSGFRFTDGAGNAISVPPQIAGKPSDVAPGDQSLALQAVRTSDSDPAQCEPAFPAGTSVEVDLGAECRDPSTCAGTELAVTNNGATTEIDTSDDNSGGGAASYETVALQFGANAEAPLVLHYDDAGALQLHARANPIDDGSGTPPVVEYITGASRDFPVRPFGFHIEVPNDTSETGPGGDILTNAGLDFEVKVSAVAWQAADDDGTGQPEDGADLSDNTVTTNFGQASAPDVVQLMPAADEPAGGDSGHLTGASFDGSDFVSGSRTQDIQWDEVGYLNLTAELDDGEYLDSGEDVTGTRNTVGRFIPADFAVAVRGAGVYDAVCDNDFTYIGQSFGYEVTPRLDITARNAAGGTTRNYRGAYNKLANDDVAVSTPGADASAVGDVSGTTDVAVSTALDNGTMADDGNGDPSNDGVTVYTFAASDRYTYDKVDNARIAPFDSDLPLEITDVTDGDAVSDGTLPAPFTPGATELRFGRLVIDNAGGTEIAPIDVPLRAEYWNGGTWNVNDADNCTTLALSNQVELSNGTNTGFGDQPIDISTGTGQTSITSGDPALSGGLATVTFSAPGSGNTGWIDMTALLGAGSPDHVHLQGDPEEDGSWTTNPSGRVTFGIYGGNDRWIDIRRVPVN